jgi:hypothetical protein
MTSSARPSRDGWIVRPSALAVLRFKPLAEHFDQLWELVGAAGGPRGEHSDAAGISRSLRLRRVLISGELHDKEGRDEREGEGSAWTDHGQAWAPRSRGHAATAVCWLSTVAILFQPSILRNLICPLMPPSLEHP